MHIVSQVSDFCSTAYMLLCVHFNSDVFLSACLSVISLQYAFSYVLLNGSFNLVLDKHQESISIG